jgi:Plasmid encoded RepA protein
MADRVNDNPKDPVQMSLGGIVTSLPAVRAAKKINTKSRVHRRLIEPLELAEDDNEPRLSFQHTVFCQAGLPYRNPGDDVRLWKRTQGAILLQVEAGQVANPATRDMMEVGLPWGTKPRLILAHLNAEALRKQSPVIEVEASLSAFVKRIRGFQHGREIRMFKDQLSRLSAATVRLATFRGDRAFQVNAQVVEAFELWPELDARQRVLWPSTIQLSHQYFNSLLEHAVPLNEADLAALAHSALAIDVYCWLAQRLHRVTPLKPVFITWAALKQQFGPDYGRMDNFKRKFRATLRQVRARYQRAILDLDDRGITLHHSLPPVTKQQVTLPSPNSGFVHKPLG